MATLRLVKDAPVWRKMREKRALFVFSFEMTARCNNNCRHCYVNLPASDSRALASELSLEEVDRISSEAVELGAVWCTLTGGEPLLSRDFEEIYLLLKRKGLLVSVFSNATLIDESHVRLFKKYPPREFEVTVYGVTEKTYETVTRRPGSFADFQRGLDLLLSAGVPVSLKAMALRSNLHEHQAIAEFCRARTRDYYRYDPMLHLRIDGDLMRNLDIVSERLTEKEIVQLERADPERREVLDRNCDFFLPPGEVLGGCGHLFHCDAGQASFELTHDGKFRLCPSLTAPETVFDLRRNSLKQAWTEFVPKVRAMTTESAEFLHQCRICGIRNLCFCCPAVAHLEKARLDAVVDYFCRVANARAKLLRGDPERP
jgi:radical SAM protein with 4Fe4S-binding SPASM domain